MARSLSSLDPRGPRRGNKGSCGTLGTLELVALVSTPAAGWCRKWASVNRTMADQHPPCMAMPATSERSWSRPLCSGRLLSTVVRGGSTGSRCAAAAPSWYRIFSRHRPSAASLSSGSGASGRASLLLLPLPADADCGGCGSFGVLPPAAFGGAVRWSLLRPLRSTDWWSFLTMPRESRPFVCWQGSVFEPKQTHQTQSYNCQAHSKSVA